MKSGVFLSHLPGDLRDDIFYASGPTALVPAGAWYLSYGGSGGFNPVNTSSFRRKDLRFGDFDGDGNTDVFGVVSNGSINTWSYSKSATGSWADGFLQDALDTIDNLVVADFNGDGTADVGESCGSGLECGTRKSERLGGRILILQTESSEWVRARPKPVEANPYR